MLKSRLVVKVNIRIPLGLSLNFVCPLPSWPNLTLLPDPKSVLGEARIVQFSSVQLLSRVWLFVTPCIAAHQASLSITISLSSLKLTSIESVLPSSHLILCCPLLLLPPIPPSIRVFSKNSMVLGTKTDTQINGTEQEAKNKPTYFKSINLWQRRQEYTVEKKQYLQ